MNIPSRFLGLLIVGIAIAFLAAYPGRAGSQPVATKQVQGNIPTIPTSPQQIPLVTASAAYGVDLSSSEQIYNDRNAMFLLPVNDTLPRPLRNTVAGDFISQSRAALLYDIKNGRYLFADNIDEELPVASVTKLMAAMVILDYVKPDAEIVVKREYINVDGDGADLYAGEVLRAEDLLKIMLISSSNDAALAFDGYLREKNISLVSEMNRKAAELGMSSTRFLDPAGLNDDGYSTARDILRMAQEVDKYPIVWSILRLINTQVHSRDNKFTHSLRSTNHLLSSLSGIIGGKTGNTPKAKGSLVLLIDRNNTLLMSVVLGSDDRFGQTRKLIEWSDQAYLW